MPGYPGYNFLDTNLSNLWQQQAGQDITATISKLAIDPATLAANMACITNLFYVGETDFRLTARCQVQPYLLLTFSIILVSTILAKFLAALQLGSKKSPEMRDKFVICESFLCYSIQQRTEITAILGQVPCYTEGEESLKQTIDSLATLAYDDKRKLLLIICDGMIIGSGNDRPTPRIVLDIFGVDQTVDPEPLMFKSVGEGSKQLNYGKVWSGLYEIDGRASFLSLFIRESCHSLTLLTTFVRCRSLFVHFLLRFKFDLPTDFQYYVLDVVVAKVGRPSERSRPGNRGKRDSQILAMRFLNRVHFDSEMYPLELEMYHQIKNVIGVDPQLYEVSLMDRIQVLRSLTDSSPTFSTCWSLTPIQV
jgi:chitin synthase